MIPFLYFEGYAIWPQSHCIPKYLVLTCQRNIAYSEFGDRLRITYLLEKGLAAVFSPNIQEQERCEIVPS